MRLLLSLLIPLIASFRAVMASITVMGQEFVGESSGHVPSGIQAEAPSFGALLFSRENDDFSDKFPLQFRLKEKGTDIAKEIPWLEPRPLIYGGDTASSGEYPAFVHLMGPAICGGSLIAPNIVLTAAHCLSNGLTHVAVGGDYYNSWIGQEEGGAQHVRVTDAARHPLYNQASFSDSDFMLLKLATGVPDQPVMKLHREFELPGGEYTVIGIGRTDPENSSSAAGYLKELSKVEIPYETCSRDMYPGNIREDSMICAGTPGLEGDGDSCQGDSGGPMFYYDENDNPVQVGVVSFGPRECATEGLPAVYARVSYAIPWIQQVVCEDFGSNYGPICGDYFFGQENSVTSCDAETETLFQFLIRTDDNGADFSWELKNLESGEVILSENGFENHETSLSELCLSRDVSCWALTIDDRGTNPGFCCDGPGDDGECCGGLSAGYGIVFGSGSALYFDNPTFENPTISFNLCQAAEEDVAEEYARADECTNVMIKVRTDESPDETVVALLNNEYQILAHPSKFDSSETDFELSACLTGCLRLVILDSEGNGLSPPGGVDISYGDTAVVTDLSDFGEGTLIEFGTGCPEQFTSPSESCDDFELFLTTDSYPEETSIFVMVGGQHDVAVLHSGDMLENSDYMYSNCFTGCVIVGVFDSVGDGLEPPGFFSGSYGSDLIESISDFGMGKIYRVGKWCQTGLEGETEISKLFDDDNRA